MTGFTNLQSVVVQLGGRVAVVTGASRGVGKGIALALGDAGATVYVTGRNAGLLERASGEITARGGKGVATQCDHADDAQTRAVFDRVRDEAGRLDLLVNNAMTTPEGKDLPAGVATFWDMHPFWEFPVRYWDAFNVVGLRSHYVASALAAPLMIAGGSGLIVTVSSPGGTRYSGNVAYGVGKAGLEKLVTDMAEELRPHNVASVSFWPGFTRTESVVENVSAYPDLSRTVSPLFNGRAVVALAADPNVMAKTGLRFNVRELAQEYGFEDSDEAQRA